MVNFQAMTKTHDPYVFSHQPMHIRFPSTLSLCFKLLFFCSLCQIIFCRCQLLYWLKSSGQHWRTAPFGCYSPGTMTGLPERCRRGLTCSLLWLSSLSHSTSCLSYPALPPTTELLVIHPYLRLILLNHLFFQKYLNDRI